MANALTTLNPELWSARTQSYIRKSGVFMAIANMEERSKLSVGDTVHRPYTSDFQVNDYTKGTDVSIQDISGTDEYLSVATTKEISFYVDDIDKIQNLYNAADIRSGQAGYRLANEMDGAFFQEVENATYDFDDGDIGGSAWSPITLSASNAVKTASLVKAMMNKASIEWDRPRDLVVDPASASFIEQQVVANGFNTADLTLKNGYAGDFLGFKVFVSNNLLHESVSTNTGNVSADDTYTIGWVTFTFKASPSAAGEVDVVSDAETSFDNLTLAINGGAVGSIYIALSDADRATLTNLKAVASNTATVLTVKTSGNPAVAEVLANVTTATTIVKCLAERRGAIDMVIQKMPTTQINKSPLKTGYNFITYNLYGKKTFNEGANRMVELNVTAQ